MIETWDEFGKRVGHARRAAGFTQSDLASAVGMDRTAVTKIESGARRIDSLELARISKVLRRPVSWFLMTPSPPVISRREARDGVELDADVLLETLAADVEQLVGMGLLAPSACPDVGVSVEDVATAEQAAEAVRRHLRLGGAPVADIQRVAEGLGLYVFVLPIDAEVQGSYIALHQGGVALVQGNDPTGKRRFTAAHELGHHVLCDEYSTEWIKGGKDERERLISAFAVHLLLPRQAAVARWEALGGDEDPWNAAVHLGAEYGLSWTALCGQLRNLDLVTDDLRADLSRHRPGTADFIERELTLRGLPACPSVPASYAASVIKALRGHRFGRNRALELLHGTLDPAELPDQHDVPMDAMLDELAPL
jgi:transcriptional regulator with XRE-family HTH domain